MNTTYCYKIIIIRIYFAKTVILHGHTCVVHPKGARCMRFSVCTFSQSKFRDLQNTVRTFLMRVNFFFLSPLQLTNRPENIIITTIIILSDGGVRVYTASSCRTKTKRSLWSYVRIIPLRPRAIFSYTYGKVRFLTWQTSLIQHCNAVCVCARACLYVSYARVRVLFIYFLINGAHCKKGPVGWRAL